MASVSLVIETSDGLSRSISLGDGEFTEIGRLDCAVKRSLDGAQKISRCAARIQNDGGVAVLTAVKHELRVKLPNSALVVLNPDQNDMRLEVRRSPVSIIVKGHFDVWDRDTEDSDSDTVASEGGQSQPLNLFLGDTQHGDTQQQ